MCTSLKCVVVTAIAISFIVLKLGVKISRRICRRTQQPNFYNSIPVTNTLRVTKNENGASAVKSTPSSVHLFIYAASDDLNASFSFKHLSRFSTHRVRMLKETKSLALCIVLRRYFHDARRLSQK